MLHVVQCSTEFELMDSCYFIVEIVDLSLELPSLLKAAQSLLDTG